MKNEPKNNTLKQKAKYRVGEPMASPINTAENFTNRPCGENSFDLAEFAAEHAPAKINKKKR